MKKTHILIAGGATFLVLFLPGTVSLAQDAPPPDSAGEDTVVSSPQDNAREWTSEEMLLAQPMPMSGEERDFVFSHKSVQKLQEWTPDDYQNYVSSPIGRQILLGEGQRWIVLRSSLRAQSQFKRDFIDGKAKRPQPLPAKPQPAPQETGAAGGGIDGNQGAASGYAGDDGGGIPSMNLNDNMSPEDKFLPDASAFLGAGAESTFNRLKKLRLDISKYCKEIDALNKAAEIRKLGKDLDDAMSSVSWD